MRCWCVVHFSSYDARSRDYVSSLRAAHLVSIGEITAAVQLLVRSGGETVYVLHGSVASAVYVKLCAEYCWCVRIAEVDMAFAVAECCSLDTIPLARLMVERAESLQVCVISIYNVLLIFHMPNVLLVRSGFGSGG